MNKSHSGFSCAALAAIALGAAAPASAELLLASDESWLVTKNEPVSNWYLPGFDDSSWQQAVSLPAIPTASGEGQSIWAGCEYPNALANGYPIEGDPVGCQFSADHFVWFRATFELPEQPLSALLSVTVDDDAIIYVNGQLVASNQDCSAGGPAPVDVSSVLTAGTNLVAVVATDCTYGWAYWLGGYDSGNHQFALSINGELPDPTDVPEPMSALLLLGGTAGLAAARRRAARKAG